MPKNDSCNSNDRNNPARFIDPARAIGNPTKTSTDMDEDDDDKTVLSGGSEKFEPEMRDIAVKWCINNMNDTSAATEALANILTTILLTHSETTIFIDHKGEEFAWDDSKNEEQLTKWIKKNFKAPWHKTTIKGQKKSTRMYATHRIQTSDKISKIKGHHHVREQLKKYNAFLTVHQFDLDQWDIAHLGFLAGYNVVHVSQQQTKIKLMKEMEKITNNIPNFELENTLVRSAPVDGRIISTQAYEIQCARKDSRQIAAILQKETFRKSMVPYSLKHTHSKGFRTAIHLQTLNSANMWVVKVAGFTEEAMSLLSKVVSRQPGFDSVTPTERRSEIGEWKILVHRDHINPFYQWLVANIHDICSQFPNTLSIPANYPEYDVTSGDPKNLFSQDDSVSDAASWGTMFTNTWDEVANELDEASLQPQELFPELVKKPKKSKNNKKNKNKNKNSEEKRGGDYIAEQYGEETWAQKVKGSETRETESSLQQAIRDHVQRFNFNKKRINEPGTNATNKKPPSDSLEFLVQELIKSNEAQAAQISKMTEEQNAAKAELMKTNATQAAQIESMTDAQQRIQSEMSFLRKGMEALLQNQRNHNILTQNGNSNAVMTTTITMQDLPSSNKRKNTMTTPTKPRPDDLHKSPDVDVEMQQHDEPNDDTSTENSQTQPQATTDDDESVSTIDNQVEMDEQFVGDILQEEKMDNVTRLYSQNVNGIQWSKEGGTWPMMCDAISAIHADICCFSEINLDVNRYDISNTMRSIEKKFYSHSRFIGSTSNNKVPRDYKPGGTALFIVNDTTATIKKTTRDRMGRWSAAHLTGTAGNKIVIITAYQCCQRKLSGNTTAANCQIAQLIAEGGSTGIPNPRKAFVDELTHFIVQCQEKQESIVLVGDFNEEMNPNHIQFGGISAMASQCGLADVFSIRLGNSSTPVTYQRGSKRIDYALVTPALLPAIRAAGYDPFNYRIPSDHRGFFIDFDTAMLFGYRPSALAPAAMRDFHSRQPKVVVKYIQAITEELNHHDFWQRLDTLRHTDQPHPRLAERLDRDLTRATKRAANKVRNRFQTPWSPAFAKAWASIRFYQLARSQIKNPTRNYTLAFSQLRMNHSHLPALVPEDLDEVKELIRDAYLSLKNARQHAEAMRNAHLEERAKLYTHLEETGNRKAVERLKKAEALSKTYRKLQLLKTTENSAGITELKVPINQEVNPKECNPGEEHWRTERVPAEIESLLLTRNEKHFGQADGTPFTVGPLKTTLGYHGSGPTADLILEGTFTDEALDETSHLLLRHLKKRTATILNGTITAKEIVSKLKTWKETTSTSPSGTHLGHYHVLWRKHGLKRSNPLAEQIEQGQQDILEARAVLMNYAMKFGHSYERWQNVVNVMLQKEPGNPKIHRLRVIHLYEADYNLLLAVKWRQAVHLAEDQKLFNEGLYGSRPGRSAIEPVFLEVLQNEIYRCSMKTGITFNLDATSCYDRILASVSTLACRSVGMDTNVCRMHTETLDKAKFRLKTSIGISEQYYNNGPVTPIHGTGQGSGNSPQIWGFICNALFDAFASKACGASFASFDGAERQQIHMIGFVDDCSQRLNDFSADPQPTPATLVQRMTTEAQLWRDLLFASGGDLELPKCFYQLIESAFQRDGTPFLRDGVFAPPVAVRGTHHEVPIGQINNYTSNKILGCYVNPGSKMRKQEEVLKQKSDHLATLLQSNILQRYEVHINFWMLYLPSITYAFPVTNLTVDQCFSIQTKFMKATVSRSGFSRSMSLAIRYGPKSYGCVGLTELITEQHHATITMALKHLRTPTEQPGKMLRILLSWVQAYHGRSIFVWEDPTAQLPKFPAPWIIGVRKALRQLNGSIVLEPNDPIMLPSLRENDVYIMDVAMTYTTRKDVIERINACRRYLQILTLADITNAQGTKILVEAKTGDESKFRPLVTGECFNQRRPDSGVWATWRMFLKLSFETKTGMLREPLRNWTQPAAKSRWSQPYIYHPATTRLYKLQPDGTYSIMRPLTTTSFYLDQSIPAVPEVDCYPVKSFELQHMVSILLNYVEPAEPFSISASTTFMEYVLSLDLWERDLLLHHDLVFAPADIIQALNSGQAHVATDGSVVGDTASFGFVIADHTKRRLIWGRGPAEGANPTSYRAELYGALAASCMLSRLSQFTGVGLTHPYHHYMDNQSAIKQLTRVELHTRHYANFTLSPDWDILSMFCDIASKLPSHTFIWQKAHLDSGTARAHLSFPAQLNCEADDEAGRFQQYNQARPIVQMNPTTKVQLLLDNSTVTSHYKYKIREVATLPRYFAYLRHLYGWDIDTERSIDWSTYKQIVRPCQKERFTTLIKHIHGIAPTGHIAHRNQSYFEASCPACHCGQENNDHVLKCPAASRTAWRDKTFASLQHHSAAFHDPVLLEILRDGLQRWLFDLPELPEALYPARYHLLIRTQNRIGWSHLFRGRWSNQWKIVYEQTAGEQNVRGDEADGQRWVRRLGILLIRAWFDVWDIRTKERHGADADEKATKRRSTLRAQLVELYALRPLATQEHRPLFMRNVDVHMAARPNLNGLEDWINTFGPAIRTSVKEKLDIRNHFIQLGGADG